MSQYSLLRIKNSQFNIEKDIFYIETIHVYMIYLLQHQRLTLSVLSDPSR